MIINQKNPVEAKINLGGTMRVSENLSNSLNNTRANISRFKNNYVEEVTRDSHPRSSS